jgi:heme ABC exporter ATP-binding subunit CcmA
VNAIQISELSKRFGHVQALRRVSIEIPAGTITLVSGPNGAGKSTLLGILAALTRPTTGSVRIFGVDPFGRERAHHRDRIGYLGQDPGLYGELTVRENLEFCSRLHGIPIEQVETLTNEFRLEPVAGQRLRTLSLGYRRRAGLARAVLPQPDLLLLDEPWNGLDQEAAESLTERLQRYRSTGGTAVVVAHAPTHGGDLFDAVLRLVRGQRVGSEPGAQP